MENTHQMFMENILCLKKTQVTIQRVNEIPRSYLIYIFAHALFSVSKN